MTNSLLLSMLPVIAIIVAITVAAMYAVRRMAGGSKKKQEQAQQLVATGSKARATIVGIQPTGVIVNHINIQCQVTFQMEPLTGGLPFQAQKKMLINQTQMPRVGDIWPSWYDPNDPTTFVVGMPDGASTEQLPIFREFGIPHPLDPSTAAAATVADDDLAGDLERLSKMKADGALTEAEFQAAKAKLLDA